MRWSDGAPFTADDWVFWREDVQGNDELTPNKTQAWSPGGSLYQLTRIDDYTVEMQLMQGHSARYAALAAAPKASCHDLGSHPTSSSYLTVALAY